MDGEIKAIARGLKNFLKNTEEDELILKAALPKKAAFNSVRAENADAEPKALKKSADLKQKTERTILKESTAALNRQNIPDETAFSKKTDEAAVSQKIAQAIPPALQSQQGQALSKEEEIARIAQAITNCKRCALGETRIKAVPGEGNINAKLMFVGEGPGYDEDRQGRPFVGRAGQLLDKIIAAMGFTREEVFIANIVKCHPMIDPSDPEKRGNDRAPKSDEIAVCRRYLEQQIKIISPDYVVALGGVAAKTLISEDKPFSSVRGRIFDLKLSSAELEKPVKILATFHPAALLRNPSWKRDAWENLKVLLADMGRKPTAK